MISNYRMEKHILLTHPKIIAFFNKHKCIDINSVILPILDMLELYINNADQTLNQNVSLLVLDRLSQLEQKFVSFDTSLESKLNDRRKEYMEDVKHILNSNHLEQVVPLLRETNNQFFDKFTLTLNQLIPKTNEQTKKDLLSLMEELKQSISSETNKLCTSSVTNTDIDTFLKKLQDCVSMSNQSLVTYVSASETRMGTQFTSLQEKMITLKDSQRDNQQELMQLNKNVSDVLCKFDYGIGKGTISEHILHNLLLQHYPIADIEYVADKKETGDILFQQKGRPKILIENKDHEYNNVPKHEVQKFIRDCDIQNCCGIMIAQHRGITNKNDFELQINNGNVLLFIHTVKFNIDKINMAINIVENLKIKLDELNVSNAGLTIDKDMLDELNKEFTYFANRKNSLLKLSKDYNEKMIEGIIDIRLPSIELLLSKHFADASKQTKSQPAQQCSFGVCDFCKEPVKKSLKQHYRYCPVKKSVESATTATLEDDD